MEQKDVISAWIDDPDHPANETCRYSLELYAQLNDSEFAYVSELQDIYDETRCFFLQWVLGKEIKELVNSARISAVQSGKPFTWTHARAETLKSMTDVTLTARFLALARLKHTQGTTAKLWISQILTRKALLEDPKLPAPIQLPECLYLEILVGQMSAQETTVFDHCPAIGDDLLQTTASGQMKYTLDKLKRSIDACSNPPYFRGVSTPITDLLDAVEPKATKQKRDQSKDKEGKTKDNKPFPRPKDKDNAKPNPHLARRPDHEQPAKLPDGLKRPDLEAAVDGKKIASEAQRQLYDDIKRGNCTRCHKGGHIRKDCTEPKAKWEEKFDKEKSQYWASVLTWQQKATEQHARPKAATHPPTLHVKSTAPEKRFNVLADDDSDDEQSHHLCHYGLVMRDPLDDDDGAEAAQHLPPPTLLIPEILADVDRQLAYYPIEASQHLPPPTLPISEILADVDRQLVDPPVDVVLAPYAEGASTNADQDAIAKMDAHVRFILDGNSSRLFLLNTALGHHLPLPSLTEKSINNEIAEMYACYYGNSSDDDEDEAETEMQWLLNNSARHVDVDATRGTADSPPYTQPYVTTSTPHSDLDVRFEANPRAMKGSQPTPAEPPDHHETSTGSSSVAPSPPTLRPRASWMVDEGDNRTEAKADADWHRANHQLLPPPAPAVMPRFSFSSSAPTPIMPTPHVPEMGAPPQPWGDAPLFEDPLPVAHGWHIPQWGEHEGEPDPEPQAWGSRRYSSDDEADPTLYHYVQTRSSFQGGTTVNATGFVRDPSNTKHPLSTRPVIIGLDSYSDVTVAHRDIVYNVRPIYECLSTGGGITDYHEEGLVDVVDGPCSFRTLPALVASDPTHLPTKCLLLLGVPQLNELNIKLDTHRKARRLPLESYDPSIDFSADTHLQCRMSEKDLTAWAKHHKDTPVGYTLYSHLDVIYDVDTRSADELRQLRAASAKYKGVFNAAKGALPALANHPPVTLNFKPGWKHVSVPVPKWGPGATAVLTRWAKEMLDSGLYTLSKSPSASRPHIVRKPPPNAPKDVDITQCGIRVCGDYRRMRRHPSHTLNPARFRSPPHCCIR
jgi:hypothetical protein